MHKVLEQKKRTQSKHAVGRTYKLKVAPPVSDHAPVLKAAAVHTLPKEVDLRKTKYMPSVLDQGQLGACAAHAMANDLAFLFGKETGRVFRPSRLALYYDCRVLVEHEPADEDTGVTIADMVDSVREYHACPEADWPYVVANFSQPPPDKAVADAALHKRFASVSVPQTLDAFKTALNDGFPVLIGIEVFAGFESEAAAETGVIPMPQAGDESLGGHAQLIVGYSDTRKAFLSLNSWGATWGQGGFCWIPYAYVLCPDYAQDFWSVRLFE